MHLFIKCLLGALVEAFTGSLAIHPENYGKSLTKDLPLN